MAQGEEKTESPTEYKLRQAREKGQVAKSADVVTLAALAAALLFLTWFLPFITNKFVIFFRQVHQGGFSELSSGGLLLRLREGAELWVLLTLPALLAAGLGAIVGNIGQFGFLLSGHPIKPDLKKLNPVNGLKKMFSKDRLVELIKQLVKFTLIFWILYQTLSASLFQVSLIFRVELVAAIGLMTQIVSTIIIRVLLCFLLISLLDLLWQRYSFIKSMRMSKYEVKKEYKQQEGDPQIKQERRRMHQELQEEAAVHNLSEAAVVITNPAHVAVAIKYDDSLDAVPTLIAKGGGRLAKEIIKEATRLNIPVIRNVPLARDLQWLGINEQIPQHLYDSVAEVLIFIHELNNKYTDKVT